MDSNERLLEGVKGRRVQHLLLDLGGVGAPGHQEELLLLAGLCGALALVLVLIVIQPVPALPVSSLACKYREQLKHLDKMFFLPQKITLLKGS